MQELWFLRFACRLMLIDIHIKYREDILNGFQVIEWKQFLRRTKFQGGNNSKSINARVMVFLRSACRLMFIDIYMKSLEDILNRFQVTEWTRFCDGQSSKGNDSKKCKCKSCGSCALHVV